MKKNYIVISISFESTDEYFQSLGTLARGLAMDIFEALEAQGVSEDLRKIWEVPVSEEFPMRDFGRKITALCKNSDRKVVLMIDEVDKNAENQIFLSFLGMLREKYLKQRSGESLGAEAIAGLLREYEQDYHTGMDIEFMSRQLFEYTAGYPFLVSRLCKSGKSWRNILSCQR